MHKKIVSALLAAFIVSGMAACAKKNAEPETTTSTEAATTVTEATTTVTEATTVTTTSAPATTEPTTAKPTTTKKVTTTVKQVLTTIAETTEPTTKKPELGDLRTEDKSENLVLRYGVLCSRATTTTYIKLEDGSEEVYDVDVTEVYTRIGYSASYEDLLPAAEENKKKYTSEIEEVLDIINDYRREGGLEPLVLDDRLTTVACARAEEIAWSGRFSHYRPNGRFFSTILKDAGITKGSAGENIARRFDNPDDVCAAWKDSETHYANIMNPEFTRVGIGIAADPDPEGKLCWSQLFIDELQ